MIRVAACRLTAHAGGMTQIAPRPSPCPTSLEDAARDYARVAEAIRFIDTHRRDQPDLAAVAAAIGLSPAHAQRLFTRWAGVSPKRFLGVLTFDHARRLLRDSASILDTALDVGLSGPSRLHDLCLSMEAMTPGEIASGGAGQTVTWGLAPSPFGPALAAFTGRGLVALDFLDDDAPAPALDALRADWPAACLEQDDPAARRLMERLFLGGSAPLPRLVVRGTNFQVRVWEALMRAAPPGRVLSYGTLASAAGAPGASRAVGSALAANRIAWLIPCHRVLRNTGDFTAYRWGRTRRWAMLTRESAEP